MRFIYSTLFFFLSLQSSPSEAADNKCLIERYIFDVGSGGINSVGYEVDICKQQINRTIASKYYNLPLQNCISNSSDSKTIPESCINEGKQVFASLKEEFRIDCKEQQCLAIATAWARNANNAEDLIDVIKSHGIDISILSQHEEGKISFHSLIKENNIPPEQEKNILVFDIGGGSFQLNDMDDNGKIHVYKGPYGMFNFKPLVLAEFPHSNDDILPVTSVEQIKKFAREKIRIQLQQDTRLSNKLSKSNLKVLGTGLFMGIGMKIQLGLGDSVSIHDIEKTVNTIIGKTIPEIRAAYPNMPKEYASNAQFSLLIIYAIMKEGNIEKINIPSNGEINKYLALHSLS